MAKNFATYYFKHEDTDSDMDKIERMSKQDVQSTLEEETSEEEWTFIKTTNNEKDANTTITTATTSPTTTSTISDDDPVKTKTIPEDTIRRLVIEAEELVSPDKCQINARINSLNKMSRVKKWLSMDKPDDSCDASCEDDERESQFSEDFDESTTTFRASQGYNSQNTSYTELDTPDQTTPKVNLRQKQYTGNRPWSVSCISQLGHSTPRKTFVDFILYVFKYIFIVLFLF